jgi:hypothetical protein
MLYRSKSKDGQMELALALARQVGKESGFINLWRGYRADPTTAGSKAANSAKKTIGRVSSDPTPVLALEQCAEALARGEMDSGALFLQRTIRSLPIDRINETSAEILRHCDLRLGEFGAERPEYLLLAFHVLREGLGSAQWRVKR